LVKAIVVEPILASGTRLTIWNCSIGSALKGPCCSLRRRDARGPDHVDDSRREAEQQKHDQPQRRGPDQPVERPADRGADQHAGNELGREPKAPRETCRARAPRIGGRSTTVGFGGVARPFAAELITETPEPCGKGLVGWTLRRVLARIVGH
jgi:hypothetical protein